MNILPLISDGKALIEAKAAIGQVKKKTLNGLMINTWMK